jgi:hypothetical protein
VGETPGSHSTVVPGVALPPAAIIEAIFARRALALLQSELLALLLDVRAFGRGPRLVSELRNCSALVAMVDLLEGPALSKVCAALVRYERAVPWRNPARAYLVVVCPCVALPRVRRLGDGRDGKLTTVGGPVLVGRHDTRREID